MANPYLHPKSAPVPELQGKFSIADSPSPQAGGGEYQRGAAAMRKAMADALRDHLNPRAAAIANGVEVPASPPADKARIAELTDENERLREALTPSGETKDAYMSEFSWTEWLTDEHGLEQGHERMVPWITIKEIMAAIRARAALENRNAG